MAIVEKVIQALQFVATVIVWQHILSWLYVWDMKRQRRKRLELEQEHRDLLAEIEFYELVLGVKK